jgi:uncharacterized membrane protein YphA (DoxX/SURF4 family)
MRVLISISRLTAGAVFVFSGFVKAVDPMGSTYKFIDYFIAFHIRFLEPIALPLAIILSSIEFLIGISMLLGYRYRLSSWALLIFMSFFTMLTFILALTNPVSDCGCFGDAIIMTNWQTFIKNIILLPFVIFIFIFRKRIVPLHPDITEWIYLAVFAVLIITFQVRALRHLPLLDFRPYSVGTHIHDKMIIPEGAPADEYETILYYEKEGQVKEFNEENYPWQDSTWKFVDSKHILLKKGYEPPIHDLTVLDEYGVDHTDAILNHPGYIMLLVSYNLSLADKEGLKIADDLAASCYNNNCLFYCLTATSRDEIKEISEALGLNFNFYVTDEIVLKTIIRANPGLVLIKEGTILGKWHYRDYPYLLESDGNYLAYSLNQARRNEERLVILFMGTLVLLVASLIRLTGPTDAFRKQYSESK